MLRATPAPVPTTSAPSAVIENVKVLPPPWLRGKMEAPAGEKDMGGWTRGVFTPEQQGRLGVDENGAKVVTAVPVVETTEAPGRVYWESNTTTATSSLNSGSEVTEQEVTEPEPRQEVLVPEQKVVSSWNPASQSWFEGLFPMGKQKIGTYGKGVASTSVVYEFMKYATPWISCGSATPLEFASAIPSRPVFVVDVVMVAYDIDVLEIRLYEHAPYVDLFIVVESTTTQRGAPKPLFFERYRNRFASIADRIVYKVVEGKRHDHDGLDERTDEWLNENVPRQQGMSMVREYRGSKPLVVLSGDVDEFWSREALESLTRGPVEGIASPSSMYTFFNGVYAQPHGPYQSRSGAIPLAWSLPQAKNPKHASTVLHKGIGFNMGSTFSPIAWMCKELSVSEGGGISWAHSDARTRVQHPWVDFEKYRVGIRPCCNDRARPKRSTTDTSPIPRLLTDEPTRFPYLMGNATPCEASTLASGAYPDVCTPSKQLFGLCASNDNDNPIKSVMVPEPKPVENVPEVHKPMIAICAATHSKSTWRSLGDTALQNILIPSMEKTISTSDRSKYDFRLYLAADHDDQFWLDHRNNLKAPGWLSVHVGFYEVPKHKIPFNPMMRAAYDDGAEYIVRINDDSEFVTSGWISKAVAKLASYDPPNVGMVGPNCREGNRAIMTHDMVHRTHLDIFEHYYPDVFSAWWIDDWISKVYGPQRSTKMMDWTVKHHTHKHGTRYEVQHHEKQLLSGELEKGAGKIREWLLTHAENMDETEPWSVCVTVTNGFHDMFNNWWFYYSKLHLNMNVIMIAEDQPTYGKYSSLPGIEVWKAQFEDLNERTSLNYDTVQFKKLMSRRASHFLRVLDANPKTIFADIDTVWLRDPRPFFTGNLNIWAQLDAENYYCAGFIAMIKSDTVMKFLKEWNEELVRNPQHNQPLFNKLIKRSDVKHKALPRREFPSGKLYFEQKKRDGVVVVHNNFIIGKDKKIQRFKEVGLWHQEKMEEKEVSTYEKKQASKLNKNYATISKWDLMIEKQLYDRFSSLKDTFEGPVLCVGARLGGEVRAFKRITGESIGIDFNPGKNNPDVIYGDAMALQFENNRFETVYCNILDHIPDLKKAFGEMIRVLNPGGTIFFDIDQNAPDQYAVRDLRKFDWDLAESYFGKLKEKKTIRDEKDPGKIFVTYKPK